MSAPSEGDHALISEAWREAARDLGIDVTAPFSLRMEGVDHEYLAHVPHFGGGEGIVVATLQSDRVLRAAAKSANYRCSFVNVELYSTYERVFFIETLTEWGFTGPVEKRPAWLDGEAAHATP